MSTYFVKLGVSNMHAGLSSERDAVVKLPKIHGCKPLASSLYNKLTHLWFQHQSCWSGTWEQKILRLLIRLNHKETHTVLDLSCDSTLRIPDFTSCSSCTFQSWRTLESKPPLSWHSHVFPTASILSKFHVYLFIFWKAFWSHKATWQERILEAQATNIEDQEEDSEDPIILV